MKKFYCKQIRIITNKIRISDYEFVMFMLFVININTSGNDKVLVKHYDFSKKELEFVINYDIKYIMGSELLEIQYGQV